MANVAHSSLTGASLHEPKGVAAATAGQIYVSNGLGSGTWTTVTGLVFTGMVADFTTPVAPTGWLECDGTPQAKASYPALYDAITIQQTGTRVGGLFTITGLTSTTHMRAGYIVCGTGLTSGSVIVSVDSSTQITINVAASNSGTSTVIISPWNVTPTSFNVPNLISAGSYRRSRNPSIPRIGQVQADTIRQHTHTGATSSNGTHSHTAHVVESPHTHTLNNATALIQNVGGTAFGGGAVGTPTTVTVNAASTGITVNLDNDGAHTHTFTSDVNPNAEPGGGETRPASVAFLTCVKT